MEQQSVTLTPHTPEEPYTHYPSPASSPAAQGTSLTWLLGREAQNLPHCPGFAAPTGGGNGCRFSCCP